MFGQVGTGEILVVLIIALIVLGPKRLPQVARSVGRTVREFREQLSFDRIGDDEDEEEEREPEELAQSSSSASQS
jgi:sec-independent protein translocase protein TatA